jgi:hypothetical protein
MEILFVVVIVIFMTIAVACQVGYNDMHRK